MHWANKLHTNSPETEGSAHAWGTHPEFPQRIGDLQGEQTATTISVETALLHD